MDQATRALNNGECVIGIFLNFTKAFNTINHSKVIDIIDHIPTVSGVVLEWFRSYL